MQHNGAANDFILEVDVVVILFTDGQQELGNVVGVQRRALCWQAAWQISDTDMNDVLFIKTTSLVITFKQSNNNFKNYFVGVDFTRPGGFNVTTGFSSQIDDD